MPRTWLAIVGAPLIGAVAYAFLTLNSLPRELSVGRPSALWLVVSGAVVGLIFEVAVVVPLYLALRYLQRLNVWSFIALGSVAWFVVCMAAMFLLSGEFNAASATAALMLLPGVALVSAFWFLCGPRHVA